MSEALVPVVVANSQEDLRAELERYKQENALLKTLKAKGMSMKVGEKGGVVVNLGGRYPVTLYKEQWTKLLDMADDIRTFITEHDSELKTKE